MFNVCLGLCFGLLGWILVLFFFIIWPSNITIVRLIERSSLYFLFFDIDKIDWLKGLGFLVAKV